MEHPDFYSQYPRRTPDFGMPIRPGTAEALKAFDEEIERDYPNLDWSLIRDEESAQEFLTELISQYGHKQ